MTTDEAFKKYTKTKKTKYGYQVDCVKGLFGVCAPTIAQAVKEARHYFVQYYEDGEYEEWPSFITALKRQNREYLQKPDACWEQYSQVKLKLDT